MNRATVESHERTMPEPTPIDAVPGLARVAAELKAAFPLLSPEAIARILRTPVLINVPKVESSDIPKSHHTPDE
jgi:Cu/Ag efflux pump CusA